MPADCIFLGGPVLTVTGPAWTGKYADFAVLDRNPLEVPADNLDAIEVKGT